MKVKDIMTCNVTTVAPSASVREVAQIMKELKVESVPICDQGRLLGIFTEREIIEWVAGGGSHEPTKDAGSLMNTRFITTSPEGDIMDAAMLMIEHGVRRLPVVEGERLVGLVCLGDIAVASQIFGGVVLAKTSRARPKAKLAR